MRFKTPFSFLNRNKNGKKFTFSCLLMQPTDDLTRLLSYKYTCIIPVILSIYNWHRPDSLFSTLWGTCGPLPMPYSYNSSVNLAERHAATDNRGPGENWTVYQSGTGAQQKRVSSSVFERVHARDLHGNVPGDYTAARARTSKSGLRSSTRTQYNDRARQGYKYWYQDRPKPTTCEWFSSCIKR